MPCSPARSRPTRSMRGPMASSCQYCDYQRACHQDLCAIHKRYIAAVKPEQLLEGGGKEASHHAGHTDDGHNRRSLKTRAARCSSLPLPVPARRKVLIDRLLRKICRERREHRRFSHHHLYECRCRRAARQNLRRACRAPCRRPGKPPPPAPAHAHLSDTDLDRARFLRDHSAPLCAHAWICRRISAWRRTMRCSSCGTACWTMCWRRRMRTLGETSRMSPQRSTASAMAGTTGGWPRSSSGSMIPSAARSIPMDWMHSLRSGIRPGSQRRRADAVGRLLAGAAACERPTMRRLCLQDAIALSARDDVARGKIRPALRSGILQRVRAYAGHDHLGRGLYCGHAGLWPPSGRPQGGRSGREGARSGAAQNGAQLAA